MNGLSVHPGTSLRRTALWDQHVALGARMVPFAGWEMPIQYAGIVAEHNAVRTAAGIFDVSHLGRAWLDGAGAAARLRSVSTYDVTALAPGRAHYSLYCNEAGGIEDDVFVYRLATDRVLVVHNAANAEGDLARVRAVAGGIATDVTGDTAMLAVQGPRGLATLQALFGESAHGLRRHECREFTWEGITVLVARTGYTGEDGGEVIVPAGRAADLWGRLTGLGAQPCGLGARDTLRLEASLPLHGNDITAATTPYEAGLAFAVTLDDGAEFTGRDALVRLSGQEPDRKLACLRTDGRAVLHAGYRVLDADGRAVTELTSGTFSPTLQCGIGMAYLPPPLTTPGTALAVEVRGKPVSATVVPRPFYRPRSA